MMERLDKFRRALCASKAPMPHIAISIRQIPCVLSVQKLGWTFSRGREWRSLKCTKYRGVSAVELILKGWVLYACAERGMANANKRADLRLYNIYNI